MHGIIRVKADAQHRSLCSFRIHASGSWAGDTQGWGCRDTKPQSTPPKLRSKSKFLLGSSFHSIPMPSFIDFLQDLCFLSTWLDLATGTSGPGWERQVCRWCLAFLCFQSSSWWKASHVSTSKENPEPRVMYWFRVLACFEKLTLLSFGRSSVLECSLHQIIFRTSALSSFLETLQALCPDSVPSDSIASPNNELPLWLIAALCME